MADVKGLLADPEFQRLDPTNQKLVLGRVDPAFSNLSDQDFNSFKQRMGVMVTPNLGGENRPGWGERLVESAGKYAPLKPEAGVPFEESAGKLLTGIGQEPGRVWDELSKTGQAMLDLSPGAAAYHLAGSIPFLGPQAQSFGDNLGQSKFAEAVGDVLPLVTMLKGGGEIRSPQPIEIPGLVKPASKGYKGMSPGGELATDAASHMLPGPLGLIARYGKKLIPKGEDTGPVYNPPVEMLTDAQQMRVNRIQHPEWYDERTPAWPSLQPSSFDLAPTDIGPIPRPTLPSGRPLPNTGAPPPQRVPLWQGLTTGELPPKPPAFEPIPPPGGVNPSGRAPGVVPDFFDPTAFQGGPTVRQSGPVKLPPIDKFEMNRMAHARAQELELPGSPAGKSGHTQLSKMAKDAFGVNSWSELDVPQMRAIHDFIDTNKRLPRPGEISIK